MASVIMAIIIILLIFLMGFVFLFYLKFYKKVPPGSVMIVYGKGVDLNKGNFVALTGGGHFIVPVLQAYEIMPLDERSVSMGLKDLPSKGGHPADYVNVESVYRYRIGTSKDLINNAVISVLRKTDDEKDLLTRTVIEESTRRSVQKFDIESLHNDIDVISDSIKEEAERNLNKYGFELRSFLIKRIWNDGYIEKKMDEVERKARAEMKD